MNECAAAEERGTALSSGHIYFLSSYGRIRELVRCRAELIQLELCAVLS